MTDQSNPSSISFLINSAHFFLDYVLIVNEKKGFRLLVVHKNKKWVDKRYKTLKEAQTVFGRDFKKYGYICNMGYMKPVWSPFYSPEEMWLEALSNHPEKPFIFKFKLRRRRQKKASNPNIQK